MNPINVGHDLFDQPPFAIRRLHASLPEQIAATYDALDAQLKGKPGERRMPAIQAAIKTFMDRHAPDAPPELRLAASMTGEAAERSGIQNMFHNPRHSGLVVFGTMALIQVNQLMAAADPKVRRFDSEEIATLLIGAAGHDLGHDGKTNRHRNAAATEMGDRLPFRLEGIAAGQTDGIMAGTGVSGAVRANVAALIFATDLGEPKGTKFIADPLKPDKRGVPAELQPLVKSPRLLGLAQVLGDADLLISIGLKPEKFLDENRRLGKEWGTTMGVAHYRGFLDVVGNTFQSPAGQFFNPQLAAIRDHFFDTRNTPAMASPPPAGRPVAHAPRAVR